MFRRILKRRAARAAKKAKKLEKTKSIYRKVDGSSPPSIQPAVTLGMSEDESDQDSTITGSESVCKARNELLLQVMRISQEQDIGKKDDEIRKLQLVIDQLKEFHQEVVEEKDIVICKKKEEVSRTKEELIKANSELAQVKATFAVKKLELAARKQDLLDKDFNLRKTESELKTTKKALGETRAIVTQQQTLINEQTEEISKLSKVVKYGKTSGKVVMGLLALGAMGSNEGGSRSSF